MIDELRRQYPDLIRSKIAVRCLAGWQELIERALDEVIGTGLPADEVEIFEIREKFGRLRISAITPAARRDVGRVFILASLRSQYVCEMCGDEGRSYSTPDNWRLCRCERHAEESPVPLSVVRPIKRVEMPDGCWSHDRGLDRLVLIKRT